MLARVAVILVLSSTVLGCSSSSSSAGSCAESYVASVCPTSQPPSGGACTVGVECTWGCDPRFGCRDEAVCTGSATWRLGEYSYPCPTLAAECPTVPPPSQVGAPWTELAPCTRAELGLTCVLGGNAYTCTACTGTLCPGPLAYRWYVTKLADGCPSFVPNMGTACGSPDLICDYNGCNDDSVVPDKAPWAFGVRMECRGGAWQQPSVAMACP